MRRLLLFLALLAVAQPLFAWGEKGHLIENEAATLGLPNDMPSFFYQSFPELVYLANDPDRLKNAGESLEAVNPPDHFLDYEYVEDLKLPADRYKYIDLLGTSGTLRRHDISNSTPGFLPWKIAEMSDALTQEWRLWRASAPGSPERRYIERNIVHLAGTLGHFVGDAANPHHTTINFNSWVLPNPNGYAIDCNVHDRFERYFISHAIETSDVKLAAPVLRTNYFAAALSEVRESNAEVERLYQIDRDGAFDLFKRVSPVGKAFAVERLGAGASMLRDLWWSTWKNSAKSKRALTAND